MTTEIRAQSETAQWFRSFGTLRGTAPPFDLAHLPDEPTELFRDWLREAERAGVPEPLAATLATAGADGLPDARTLLVKDMTASGWAFAGSRSSAKASQLGENPAAALNFWWQPLLRAVRVRGSVVDASRAEIEAEVAARATAVSGDDWMLWWIRPVRVEFWQGAVSRNHTRLVYEANDRGWSHSVIAGEGQGS
ncbi:MAG: pyridoxamine 5'-phosphate oxidase family protein [Rhodoglobus sp.]